MRYPKDNFLYFTCFCLCLSVIALGLVFIEAREAIEELESSNQQLSVAFANLEFKLGPLLKQR